MYLELCLPYVTVLHLGKEKSSVFLRLYLLMSQLKRSESNVRFFYNSCVVLDISGKSEDDYSPSYIIGIDIP